MYIYMQIGNMKLKKKIIFFVRILIIYRHIFKGIYVSARNMEVELCQLESCTEKPVLKNATHNAIKLCT